MTMTNASSTVRGRRVKFTPQAIEKIKEFVAEGISRDEIANRLGVTVGSLQVTCSRLGISLRRTNRVARRGLDVRERIIPTLGSVGIAQAASAVPVAKLEIMMRCHGKEKATDIPLSSPAIGTLALEATSRDLTVAELLGQLLVAAINKDMIHEILP